MGFRKERVGEMIRQELSLMLLKGDIKDPRLSGVSITGADVSGDLQFAKVWFVPPMSAGETAVAECVTAFEQASGFIRTQLGRRLRLRLTPTLRFLHDPSLENGDRINRLLAGLADRPASE